MKGSFQKIKYWFSDWRYRRNHDRESDHLNSELNKRYYKSNTSDIIKILTELDKKAGLSAYDIVPFLKKIGRMPYKGSFVEKGSGGSVTDRHRNDEFFKELEQLEFIRITENNLFSTSKGIKFKTSAENCVLKIKLLPKGIDYLTEHNKRKKDYKFAILTVILLFLTALFSIPQACNNWEQYQTLKDSNKNTEISKSKTDIKTNDNPCRKIDNKLEGGEKTELVIKPILKTTEHKEN